MLRHVKDQKLAVSFSEIFDFLDLTKNFELALGEDGSVVREVEGEMKKVQYEDVVCIDWVIGKNSPDYQLFAGKDSIKARVGDILAIYLIIRIFDLCLRFEVVLNKLDADIFFNLRGVEALEILTLEQLKEAQELLTNTNPLKAPRAQRQEAMEMRDSIQEQLNKFHQAFADIARGSVAATQVTSTLQLLRYDFKFNKSRRIRTLNQRAVKNASAFSGILN